MKPEVLTSVKLSFGNYGRSHLDSWIFYNLWRSNDPTVDSKKVRKDARAHFELRREECTTMNFFQYTWISQIFFVRVKLLQLDETRRLHVDTRTFRHVREEVFVK